MELIETNLSLGKILSGQYNHPTYGNTPFIPRNSSNFSVL